MTVGWTDRRGVPPPVPRDRPEDDWPESTVTVTPAPVAVSSAAVSLAGAGAARRQQARLFVEPPDTGPRQALTQSFPGMCR